LSVLVGFPSKVRNILSHKDSWWFLKIYFEVCDDHFYVEIISDEIIKWFRAGGGEKFIVIAYFLRFFNRLL